MSWKEQLNFGEPTYTDHEVGDGDNKRVMQFYPVSVGMMFKLRRAAKPLAKAFATLTSGGRSDNSQVYREIGDPAVDEKGRPLKTEDGEFIRDTETIREAVSVELAKLRVDQRTQATEDLISALTDDENLDVVVRMIGDSLRIKDMPPSKEFMEHVTAPVFAQMLVGVAKANKGVLGPLGEKLGDLLKGESVEEAKETLRDNLQLTPKDSGEPSQRPSSSSQSEDTTQTG